MNLLVARHFTEADGVVDAAKLGMAAKPYSMFDPKLIELQKQYAKDILTHYNPYTKLRYCDDPAVALVEIINETTLKKLDIKKAPAYYSQQLEKMGNISPDDIEKRYYDSMIAFLKTDIGVKVPITGSQYSSSYALSACDFLDKHAYWDHPKFPHKPWDINDFTIHNKSALLDKDLGIIGNLVVAGREAAKQSKPFTVTEWNHCYPNQYAYETPVLIACEALKNDWDGLFQFAFSHGWKSDPEPNDVRSFFDVIANPQKLMTASMGSLIFLKGGQLQASLNNRIYTFSTPYIKGTVGFINNSQNGAIALIKDGDKWNTMAVSEVKNTASGWNKEGKFGWGHSPVLLKKINVEKYR
jgi:hypothetical protein